jgi:hypothetical protein
MHAKHPGVAGREIEMVINEVGVGEYAAVEGKIELPLRDEPSGAERIGGDIIFGLGKRSSQRDPNRDYAAATHEDLPAGTPNDPIQF